MKDAEYLLKGFLFSLGFLPVVVFSVWLFHNWPLWSTSVDGMEELSFDKSQIELGQMKLNRSAGGISGLGEITNRSGKACSFLMLECDLFFEGKIIAHEMAVVSDLTGHSTRGYTVPFSGIADGIELAKLTAKIAVTQAFNIDAQQAREANGNQPSRLETNRTSSTARPGP